MRTSLIASNNSQSTGFWGCLGGLGGGVGRFGGCGVGEGRGRGVGCGVSQLDAAQ